MKVLLIAMPDKASCFDKVMDMPNLGVCCIAGNIEDVTTNIRILDLAIHQKKITRTLEEQMTNFDPDVVGMSSMSFQYASARKVADICRSIKKNVITVLGGYHATLLYKEIGGNPDRKLFDFVIRGEGEVIFNRLLQELKSGRGKFDIIDGLSFKQNSSYHHNPPAQLLNLHEIKLPARKYRISDNFEFMGRKFDCAETSRGCVLPCNFCTITKMYGKSFREYPIHRVIADLKNLKANHVKGVFLVDDNVTLNVSRLKELCKAMVEAGVNDLDYIVQATISGIASDKELSYWLKKAGFHVVFLGIENGIDKNLEVMHKKNIVKHTHKALAYLQEQGIITVGGLIVGNPDDTSKDVHATFRYALELGLDHAIIQCLTPYPKTESRELLLKEGLIVNTDDLSQYNGFIPNVKTKYLSNKELSRSMLAAGIKLYFHPRYMIGSKMWRRYRNMTFRMFANNLKLISSGLRGRLFQSTHSF